MQLCSVSFSPKKMNEVYLPVTFLRSVVGLAVSRPNSQGPLSLMADKMKYD
jgi:hypothetical protein